MCFFGTICQLTIHMSILIDFSIHFETIALKQSIRWCSFVLYLADSVDPDEIPHSAVFHHGLHCLPRFLFTGIQNRNCYHGLKTSQLQIDIRVLDMKTKCYQICEARLWLPFISNLFLSFRLWANHCEPDNSV